MPDEPQHAPEPEQVTDLNLLALAEFRSLVAKDQGLPEEWRLAVAGLADNGVPKDLSFLDGPLEEKQNDHT